MKYIFDIGYQTASAQNRFSFIQYSIINEFSKKLTYSLKIPEKLILFK